MIYVGIDIAKLNHFAAAISSDGEILIEPFKFSNNYDGFYLLLSHLAPLDQNSIIIGLESTAHYGDNLVRFLISKGFKVCVLNPIQTSFMRKNNVRKTKTDKVDTFVIAKTLMMQDSLRFMALEDLDYIELKSSVDSARTCEAAYTLKNSADFLCRPGIPGTTILL
ncbi:IS110 family transposase [Enterocloster bolteae]|nr:IS110 family transposase [Enterocloster bolteae]